MLGRIGRAFRSNRKATAGIILLAIFILVALFPGVIAHDSPTADVYPPGLAFDRPALWHQRVPDRTCSRRWCGLPGTS